MKTIRTGSQVILHYAAGDVDRATVVQLTRESATVRLQSGRLYRTVIEDIGIGVDDSLEAVFDDGSTYPRARVVRSI